MDSEKVLEAFGANLRRIRETRKISQEKLGEIANIDRTYVSSAERGKRNVSLINIIKFANALEVNPSALLDFQWEEMDEIPRYHKTKI
ncbi:DNA-binding transcriptional regulator, XRE-family HTH domain [Pseudidiomarina maritima]|uniref:DNA-binding transcriptional regulator, XRE-family HTH domain n=1 Tax=Pseudidiomarina maritima TaxID=519453 RepID=A0A1I6H7M5_9GAMM|nr:helix-turn-helix transcriptional regulator [Pseudidiomarina maritima]SFR50368.1 DNA-binding transcriptional regulator, XRE-family HTH domain [Pseudidiomarina maritima]